MSGTLFRVPANGPVEIHRHEGSGTPGLAQLQKLVGGYIERIRVHYENRVRDAYVDEEGVYKYGEDQINYRMIERLAHPFNPVFTTIVGPAVVWVPDPKPRKPKIAKESKL